MRHRSWRGASRRSRYPKRTVAAGAFVDGATWDALHAPATAIYRFDSAAVLGPALFDPGPTGINHGDIVAML